MTEWRWIGADILFAIHDRQIAEHGGLDGIRDLNAIESAIARPRHLANYGNPDAAALAAAYAFGLARNHGFSDGNKRVAWITARLFLADNGFRLIFDPAEAVKTVEMLAAGLLAENDLADWFRKEDTETLVRDHGRPLDHYSVRQVETARASGN